MLPHQGLTHQTPALRGRWTLLRPVEREDFRTLFAWRSDLHEVHLWTTQGRRIVTFDQFVPECEAWLRDSIVLLAQEAATGVPFGFGRAYNLNLADQWVWVQAYANAEARLRPYLVTEAGGLFAEYLFSAFPLRKIHTEVFGYNDAALHLHERIGFKATGRFEEHVWYRDRFWDSTLYCLTREDWLKTRERLHFLLGVESGLQEEQLRRDRAPSPDGIGVAE